MNNSYSIDEIVEIMNKKYKQYLFRGISKRDLEEGNELVIECAKYGMSVGYYENLGVYLIGSGDEFYGEIDGRWRELEVDMPALVAELFVAGPFRDVP